MWIVDALRGRRRVQRSAARELDDEERAALTVEREHREQADKRGEAYIRTYADPAANWGRNTDPRDDS